MTPERLDEISEAVERADSEVAQLCAGNRRWTMSIPPRDGDSDLVFTALSDAVDDLLAYVDELTRQLEDARDKAINAGIFTSSDGDQSKYTHALNTDTCEDCGDVLATGGYCYRCETEISTPGATSFKP